MAGRFKMHRSAARARGGHSPSDRLLYSGEGSHEASEIRSTDLHSAAVAHHVFVGLVVGRPGHGRLDLLACQDMTIRLRSSNRTTPAATGRCPRFCRVRAPATSRRVKGARRSGPATVRKVAKRARSGVLLSAARARAVATVLGTSRNSDVRPWANAAASKRCQCSAAAAGRRREVGNVAKNSAANEIQSVTGRG